MLDNIIVKKIRYHNQQNWHLHHLSILGTYNLLFLLQTIKILIFFSKIHNRFNGISQNTKIYNIYIILFSKHYFILYCLCFFGCVINIISHLYIIYYIFYRENNINKISLFIYYFLHLHIAIGWCEIFSIIFLSSNSNSGL
mgnify:CR=1 FL=1